MLPSPGHIRKNSTPRNQPATPVKPYSYFSRPPPPPHFPSGISMPLGQRKDFDNTQRKIGISRNKENHQAQYEKLPKTSLFAPSVHLNRRKLNNQSRLRRHLSTTDNPLPQSHSKTRDQQVQTETCSTKQLLEKALQTIGISFHKGNLGLREQPKAIRQPLRQDNFQTRMRAVSNNQSSYKKKQYSFSRPSDYRQNALREIQELDPYSRQHRLKQIRDQLGWRQQQQAGSSSREWQQSLHRRDLLQQKYRQQSRSEKAKMTVDVESGKKLIQNSEFDKLALHYQQLHKKLDFGAEIKVQQPANIEKNALLGKLLKQVNLDRQLRQLVGPLLKHPEFPNLKQTLLDKFGIAQTRYQVSWQQMDPLSAKSSTQMDVSLTALKIYELVDKVDKHWCWEVRNQSSIKTVQSLFQDLDFQKRGRVFMEDLVRQINLRKGCTLRNMDVHRVFRRMTGQSFLTSQSLIVILAKSG